MYFEWGERTIKKQLTKKEENVIHNVEHQELKIKFETK